MSIAAKATKAASPRDSTGVRWTPPPSHGVPEGGRVRYRHVLESGVGHECRYLGPRVTLFDSRPESVKAVVAHGGMTPIITPNPIAAGLPTSGEPILIDISSSITSMGFAFQQRDAGKKLPGAWLIDNQGNATDDPAALSTDPPGALLPLGGLDAGYKGFGLTLLVEALTAGLSGFGRADPPEGWGGTVFVQVLDPRAFGGLDAFKRQMDNVASVAHASSPRPGVERVRLPGEAGMRRLREQREKGVALYPTIMPKLVPWAEKLRMPAPAPISD